MIHAGTALYGTASAGNVNNNGTVFSLPLTGGTPTVLATFPGDNGGPGGVLPDLVLSGSTLYGATKGTGNTQSGTVFSVPLSGGTPTVVAALNGTDNRFPNAGVTISGSTIYGTSTYGGSNTYYDNGTVFARR